MLDFAAGAGGYPDTLLDDDADLEALPGVNNKYLDAIFAKHCGSLSPDAIRKKNELALEYSRNQTSRTEQIDKKTT